MKREKELMEAWNSFLHTDDGARFAEERQEHEDDFESYLGIEPSLGTRPVNREPTLCDLVMLDEQGVLLETLEEDGETEEDGSDGMADAIKNAAESSEAAVLDGEFFAELSDETIAALRDCGAPNAAQLAKTRRANTRERLALEARLKAARRFWVEEEPKEAPPQPKPASLAAKPIVRRSSLGFDDIPHVSWEHGGPRDKNDLN